MAPIVFINRGNGHSLALAVGQAKLTNPARRIVVIGDGSTSHFPALFNVEHADLTGRSGGGTDLRRHYRHLSTNGPEFELRCLERWFVLLDWMRSAAVERVIHLDSDVLVYGDLSEAERELAQHPMTMIICSAHTSFINERDTLARFCDVILDYYRTPALQAELDEIHHRHIAEHAAGGISDMTFLRLFRLRHPHELFSVEEPLPGNCAFDLTLDSAYGGYRMRDGIKDIEWRDGVPWCRREPSGDSVRFMTLHFQGPSKKWMDYFHLPWTMRTRLALAVNRGFIARDRLQRRIHRIFEP